MPTDDTPQIPLTPEQVVAIRPRDTEPPHISDTGQSGRVGLVHGE